MPWPSSASCCSLNSWWFSRLKPMSTAGGPARSPGRLDVRIDRKAFRSADGAETVVLRDLRFELKPGSFTCLIGPSGCGKRSEEHTSELQSLMRISYAVICLKQKKRIRNNAM